MRVVLVALWLTCWELAVRWELVNPILVAKPSSMFVTMFSILTIPDIQAAFVKTILEYVIGFSVGAVVGIVLGTVLALARTAYNVLYGPLMILYATPKSIFVPLFVVFLGLGFQSPAAFAAGETIFPLVIAVVASVGALDRRFLTAASALGASTLDRVRYVILPSAVPSIVSGLWLGLKQALLAVLLAELLISGGGNIGYYITFYASVFKPDQVYALIAWLSLFAISLAFLWGKVESHASRWRSTGRSGTA